jgi:AbrB family looped-hinge helix DNA binding protein
MGYHSNMTSKGQVTVPKDIRDALGLKPGHRVRFEIDENGDARIVRADALAARDERLNRVREVRKKFKLQDPFAGMDGLEYQRWIRESPEV